MTAVTLAEVVAGFDDPVHGAQRVFRRVLDALARPGRPVMIDETTRGLNGLSARTPRALAATLLALADHDTPVWYDAACAPELAALLRFHTGAPLAAKTKLATFAAVLDTTHMPALTEFDWGSPEYPDRSATLFIAPAALEGGPRIILTGPGIQHNASIAPLGLGPDFWAARHAMQAEFPRGLDVVLCDARRVIGLPRTTRAEWAGA